MILLGAVAAVVFAYALVSARLDRSPVTAPIVFTAAGVALGTGGLGLVSPDDLEVGVLGIVAEAALLLLLFTDAIRIDLRRLRASAGLPVRLLAIGLPLAVVLGAATAWALFGDLGLAGALAVGAILAPTDAALGKTVVTDRRIPVRVRQTINVESGLNDGLALPLVAVAIALVGAAEGTVPEWAAFAARQITGGVVAGAVVGAGGGILLDRFARRGWVDGAYRQLGTLAIGVAAFAAANAAGGNGFVAAFVAGLAFGWVARTQCQGAYDFAEDEGELLALLTFMAFGATVVVPALQAATGRVVLYALLSLTVVRMLAVAVSLVGSGLRLSTIAFVGWFGPRGLASILFGVMLLEEAGHGMTDEIFSIVVVTVVASILLHGLSAAPLTSAYARWFARNEQSVAESAPMAEFPTRG